MSSKVVHTAGTRKRAIARVTLSSGSGKVLVNGIPLERYGTMLTRSRIMEPLILAGEAGKKADVSVSVFGGGPMGQADATRLAIGRALSQQSDKLKQVFLEYDRTLLVADVRRKEPAKPNSHGQARAKRQKSYR